MMKRVFGGLFIMLVLSSFVFAASSEVVADFTIDSPTREVVKYVSPESAVGDCVGYFVLVFVVLVLAYFVLKKKKVSKKKKSKKKVSRKKK